MLTETEADARLTAILAEHAATHCPQCQHEIGWGDIAWNNASTEAGTESCMVEIQCAICDTEIVHIDSWYPGIDSTTDLLYVLDTDWDQDI